MLSNGENCKKNVYGMTNKEWPRVKSPSQE